MNEISEIREWSFDGMLVRTVEIDGEPWFVGKDVAERLGYNNVNKAVQMHVDAEDIKKLDFAGFSQNGTYPLWSNPNDYSTKVLINESGVYALIFGSKLESAKRFKRWVAAEVLPTIRKTGGYQKPDSYMIDDRVERAKRWIEEEYERKVLREKLALQEAKVVLAEAITASPGCILIGELAKILRQNGIETGQRRLFKWVRENDWLCSGKAEHNHPTQRAIERGYMELQERIIHVEGKEVSRFTPVITGAGQEFFINLFLKTRIAK